LSMSVTVTRTPFTVTSTGNGTGAGLASSGIAERSLADDGGQKVGFDFSARATAGTDITAADLPGRGSLTPWLDRASPAPWMVSGHPSRPTRGGAESSRRNPLNPN
jgi:hypothetical protein